MGQAISMSDPKKVQISGVDFYIRPFSAFQAANLSGELVNTLAPAFSAIVSVFPDDGDLEKIDWTSAAPALMAACQGLSGDKIEGLLRKLIVSGGNIAADIKDSSGAATVARLDDDIVNQLFVGNLEDMIRLAYEVIKVNYGGFFDLFKDQSGSQPAQITTPRTIL